MTDSTELLSLAPQPTTEEPLSLTPQTIPSSPEVATKRAYKIVAGKTIPEQGYEEVYTNLVNGYETDLRDQAVNNENLKSAKVRQETVVALANDPNGNPSKLKDIFKEGTRPLDQGTIFEKAYADQYVNEIDETASRTSNSFWAQAQIKVPQFVAQAKSVASDVIAKRNVVETLEEDLQERKKQMGWGTALWNMAPMMLQAYQEYNLRNKTGDVGFFKGLLGTNLEETRKSLFREPTVEAFKTKLEAIVKPLEEQNPYLAEAFLAAVKGQSSTEISMNNIFTGLGILDTSAFTKAGVSLVKGAKSFVQQREVAQVVGDLVQSSRGEATKANQIAATGDVSEAATTKASANVLQSIKGTNDAIKDAEEALPSGFKNMVDDIKANPHNLAQGEVNKLLENTYSASNNVVDVLSTIAKVRRIPIEQATPEMMRALKEEIKQIYPGLSNRIMDISDPVYNPVANVYNYTLRIGQHGDQLFSNFSTAKTFARDILRAPDAKIEKLGLGFYITVTKPLDESGMAVRDLLINPYGKYERPGMVKSMLGWIRTPEDTVSFNERVHRKIVSYAQGELRKLEDSERTYLQRLKNGSLDDIARENYSRPSRLLINGVNYIGSKLPFSKARTKWADLERTLEHNQKMYDPDTIDPVTGKGQQGYFFKSPGELQNHYLTNFQRMADFDEVQAYFAHKRLWEYDYVIRNLRIYTNKARLGTESHLFKTLDANGHEIASPQFDGIVHPNIPGGDDLILIKGNKLGSEQVWNSSSNFGNQRDALEKLVQQGKLKVVELYAPEQYLFKGFGKVRGQRIRYVITDNLESKAISYNQLPRRGGGHYEYKHDYYIKQAMIKPEEVHGTFKHWYEGDKTVLAMNIRAKGKDITDKMNAVRILIMKDQDEAAKALLEKTLPFEWKEFKGWFIAKGKEAPALDVTEPFHLVPKDKMIKDVDKVRLESMPGYKDGTREGSLSRTYQVRFTGERDADSLQTIQDVGTKGNPLYNLSDADLVDPIPMMNRALARMSHSTFMDDYKIAAMERWIKEATPFMDAKLSELQYSPFYHFNNPKFVGVTADNAATINMLKANHFKIKQFVGLPNYIDTALHTMAQTLDDFTYKHLGGYEGDGRYAKKALALTPSWMLTRITDPISFVRGMTYHFKLGLFAVPQLIVQQMTYATISALAPRSVVQGTSGAMLHQWARINSHPNIIKELDVIASKMGYKPGQWEEANRLLRETGFGHVGGEYINLDSVSNFKIVKNVGQDFLDWGQVPFKEGEKNVRYGAWYTAYHEFRRKNPLGRITEAEREKILERADVLYTNMSRASASALHTGPLALTTQFLSYQLRLAELFFSKRIGDTKMERTLARARIAMVYSALYGIPAATGVSGIPMGDYIRKKAIENGYVVGDQWISSALLEGIPAFFGAWVSGGLNAKKGNWLNFGDRFGTQGFEQIKQALRGDIPWYQLLAGASGSVVGGILESSDNFFRWLGNTFRDDHKFPLRVEDITNPILGEIASYSLAKKYLTALNTGHWVSKKGHDLGEASPSKAAVMALTGMQDQATDDQYLKLEIMKEQETMRKEALKDFIIQMRNSTTALKNKDEDSAKDYYRRAFAILARANYPEHLIPDAIGRARESSRAMFEDIDWSFYTKNVPAGEEQGRMDAYRRTLQMQKERQ